MVISKATTLKSVASRNARSLIERLLAMICRLNQRYWPCLTAIGLACIIYLSLEPPYLGPPGIPGMDKVRHFCAWGVVSLPIVLARPKGAYLFLLLLWLVSGVIECVQPYFLRTFDVLDLLANAAGVLLAWYGGRRAIKGAQQYAYAG